MTSTEHLLTRRHFLQYLALTGSLSWLAGCAVNPVTGQQQLMMLSEGEEISIDKQQAPFQFSADFGVLQDPRINAYIARVGQELASRSHRPQMPFSFRCVNAAYINAYAFPGGSIAATRGILVELDNEAELAALLGHEIGHVCARHAAQQQSKGLLANLLVAGATIATSAAGYGDAADLVQGLGGLGAGAFLARYSRDNEREADALGLEYLARTGYSPQGVIGLMDILRKNSKEKPGAIELMFATHPMSEERYQTARQAVESRYASLTGNPIHRERYQDTLAPLKRQRAAIQTIQKGSLALGKKKYQEAETLLHQALKQLPNDYVALLLLARSQMSQKKHSQALDFATKATKVFPKEGQGHLYVAILSLQLDRYDQAISHFNRYETLLPGNPAIAFYRGLAYEQQGDRARAADDYRRFLQRVNQGKEAQHARDKLKQWGYLG